MTVKYFKNICQRVYSNGCMVYISIIITGSKLLFSIKTGGTVVEKIINICTFYTVVSTIEVAKTDL